MRASSLLAALVCLSHPLDDLVGSEQRLLGAEYLRDIEADFTFGPNSSTGWHTHPGKTFVAVKSGTLTVYHGKDCERHVYGPGDGFVELPSTVHIGRNETNGIVELGVVFFGVPIGGSPRIDQPQPDGCEIT